VQKKKTRIKIENMLESTVEGEKGWLSSDRQMQSEECLRSFRNIEESRILYKLNISCDLFLSLVCETRNS